ncbi:MAG: diguanylate cyclase (GGDEF)-like protein [Moritella sp.]|jgi:diguanylate cyclase (GGDEF)-like protein
MLNINTQVINIPEQMFQGWQQTVELIADIIDIPIALITRVHHSEATICASNIAQSNPEIRGLIESADLRLYCDTVIINEAALLVENARTALLGITNPDSDDRIVAYLGLPLMWPNNQAFGTLCVLDHQAQQFSEKSKLVISCFQQSIQADLEILYQKAELVHVNYQLQQNFAKQSVALKVTKQELLHEQDNRSSLEATLNYQQHYDSLTGVANQFSLVNQLNIMLEHVDDENELSVIYLGLCNFKSINNSYGYAVGDKILLEISQRIHQQLTTEHLVARCWGDSFAVVVRDKDVIEQTLDLIGRLSLAFKQLFTIDEYAINVQVSIGIALASDQAEPAVSLVEKAEAAMSASKDSGTTYNFFNQETEAVISERHHLESHLAEALNNNELSVHYQPLICVKSGRVLRAEALIRWNNPVLGAVAPDRFIHLAEQNGQILAIGNFVLRTAIEQAVRWQRQFGNDFCIAVNMSPVQFRDENLVAHIAQLLACYQLPASCLELEITEGVLLQDEKKVGTAIAALKQLGVRISLDDFGTGYASLSYLQKYSFDTLKIDRSFINNLMNREKDKELARAIIAMAKKLNLHVVAEGVETAEQHQFILDEGCDFGQGYLYGKPVPAAMFSGSFLARKVM